jgi:TonB family protein
MLQWFTGTLMRFALVSFAICVLPANLLAQSLIGVTANGKIVTVAPKQKLRWMEDVITRGPMEYPYNDRRNYHQGNGVYRVTFDHKKGVVADVKVIKSTGWDTLDAAAARGLRQLHVKPGRWKQFDVAVNYEMARSREEAMEKMRQRQAAKPP